MCLALDSGFSLFTDHSGKEKDVLQHACKDPTKEQS